MHMGCCRYCGCTEERACPSGCAWVDPEASLCSSPGCLAQVPEEELLELLAAEAQAAAQDEAFLPPLTLGFTEGLALLQLLNVARLHPQLCGSMDEFAAQVTAALAEKLAAVAPVHGAVARRALLGLARDREPGISPGGIILPSAAT